MLFLLLVDILMQQYNKMGQNVNGLIEKSAVVLKSSLKQANVRRPVFRFGHVKFDCNLWRKKVAERLILLYIQLLGEIQIHVPILIVLTIEKNLSFDFDLEHNFRHRSNKNKGMKCKII